RVRVARSFPTRRSSDLTPILAVVALLSIIATFGEFVIARVLLQSESNWTLAVGLYSWVSSLLEANWGLFAAGAVISTIPILAMTDRKSTRLNSSHVKNT